MVEVAFCSAEWRREVDEVGMRVLYMRSKRRVSNTSRTMSMIAVVDRRSSVEGASARLAVKLWSQSGSVQSEDIVKEWFVCRYRVGIGSKS